MEGSMSSSSRSPILQGKHAVVFGAGGSIGAAVAKEFAADEIFFDLSSTSWNQNRFQAGGGALLNRRFFLDVYYLQRNRSRSAPTTRVLGTTLRIALTPKEAQKK
jgi:hypothetical protein